MLALAISNGVIPKFVQQKVVCYFNNLEARCLLFSAVLFGIKFVKGEVRCFCTLSLIIRISMIIYNVLQHYCDEQCRELEFLVDVTAS